MFAGHPVMEPMSFESMKGWSLEVFKSRFFFPYSMYNYTFTFIHPNIVEITNQYKPSSFVVEYERMQPPDLRKIPDSMQKIFMDLALSDIMIWIGGIRMMYGDGRLTTPFGEIPLNGSDLQSKGEDLHDKIMERLIENTHPPIVIQLG